MHFSRLFTNDIKIILPKIFIIFLFLMLKIYVNDIELFVKSNSTVLEACEIIGILIPRFCSHETLFIAGKVFCTLDLLTLKFLRDIFIIVEFYV